MIEKKNILGVGITNATREYILEYIIKSLKIFKKKYFIVTPNPEFLVLANKNLEFKNVLNRAELASADGVGVIVASKILGKPLKSRFAGVELLESLCKEVVGKPITVGFLGGRAGVAEKTAECLQLRYPNLKISFTGEEWNEEGFIDSKAKVEGRKLKVENKKSIQRLSSTVKNLSSTFNPLSSRNIDILFVAFGAPKQEFWINENLDKIPVKIAIGVGGAFDYISGKTPRSPGFISNIGLEWLFRLAVQPWRIKRQFSLLKFIWLVFKERISN